MNSRYLEQGSGALFSILIPVCQVEEYVDECIDSVCSQQDGGWEIVCVNDGSKDGSGEIVNQKVRFDRRIRVIHQRNRGVSVARNRGLEYIRGEYFLFLDGDDILLAGALRAIREILQRHPSDLYLFPFFLEQEVFKWEDAILGGEHTSVVSTNKEKLGLICENKEVQGHVCGRIYRSRVFQSFRFPVGISLMEDQWFWMNALLQTKRVVINTLHYYGYRCRNSSVTRRQTMSQWMSVIEVWLETVRIIQKLGGVKVDFRLFWKRKAGCIKSAIGCLIHNWLRLPCEERGKLREIFYKMHTLMGLNPVSYFLRCRLNIMGDVKGGMESQMPLYRRVQLWTLDRVEYIWYGLKNAIVRHFG